MKNITSRIADCGLRIDSGGRWQIRHGFCVATLVLAVLAGACNRRPARPAAPPPPPAALVAYGAAEKSFESGDYAAAARSYAAYIDAGIAENRDRALFRAGLSWALGQDGTGIGNRSRTYLQNLLAQSPSSPYAAPARVILLLDGQVENLKGSLNDQLAKNKTLAEELKRLKDIDLRRRPTRLPP